MSSACVLCGGGDWGAGCQWPSREFTRDTWGCGEVFWAAFLLALATEYPKGCMAETDWQGCYLTWNRGAGNERERGGS